MPRFDVGGAAGDSGGGGTVDAPDPEPDPDPPEPDPDPDPGGTIDAGSPNDGAPSEDFGDGADTIDPSPDPDPPEDDGTSGTTPGGDTGLTPGAPSGDGDVAHSEPVTSPDEADANDPRRDQAQNDPNPNQGGDAMNPGNTANPNALPNVWNRVRDLVAAGGVALVLGLVGLLTVWGDD